MKRQFIFVAFALVMLYDATFAQIMPCGSAQPVLFDNNTYSCEIMKQDKCHKVMLVVTGFARASGYGASVASSVSQKGEYVACHILTRSTSTLICQEFYKIAKTKVGEMYQLDLGNPMYVLILRSFFHKWRLLNGNEARMPFSQNDKEAFVLHFV